MEQLSYESHRAATAESQLDPDGRHSPHIDVAQVNPAASL